MGVSGSCWGAAAGAGAQVCFCTAAGSPRPRRCQLCPSASGEGAAEGGAATWSRGDNGDDGERCDGGEGLSSPLRAGPGSRRRRRRTRRAEGAGVG